jgi:hypothetical protein
MSASLEYYLTGGTVRLGKKEFMFELLRKDSILRALLGGGAGDLKSQAKAEGDAVVFELPALERKLDDDPTPLFQELKRRYGDAIGGKMLFKCVYLTFFHTFSFEADLGANTITPL